jgi:leucyl/phenylalanyl-tRNA---protein transferase
MTEARLDAALLLRAYSAGLFPMAKSREDGRLAWYDPDPRGILPLESFHVPRRLARTIRQGTFEIRFDTVFDAVIEACAAPRAESPDTWINADIRHAYGALHRAGHAHSVECWRDGALAGGLYGVALGGAFFGESMFSRARDASKVALAALCERLKARGFLLLDTQFLTAHLMQFGAIEIPRADYKRLLSAAIALPARF